MRIRQIIAVSGIVLILASCSDGAPQGELTWEDSPLVQALDGLGMGIGDSEEFEREEQERQRRAEDLVAACMAEQGFDYTPSLPSSSVISFEDEDWGSEEWTAQYGYGVTTDPWADEAHTEEEWTDPNQDYIDSMSESEQAAYFAALHGEPMFFEEEDWEADEPEEYNWEEAGCYGAAQHEVYEEDGTAFWDDPAFTEFFDAANTLYEDAQRDPRVAEVNAEWAECMADADFGGMTSPDEAMNVIYEEFDRLQQQAHDQIDWESIDWEAADESGVDPVAALLDDAGMAELRERELAMAMADHRCQEDLGTGSKLLAIQFELEEEFVNTYRADIDALVAAYGQDS